MKKFLKGPLIGFLTTPAGLGVGFFYAQNMERNHPSMLGLAILLLIVGLFFLGRSLNRLLANVTGIKTAEDVVFSDITIHTGNSGGFDDTLKKNEALVSDYSKTARNRDKLEILSIAEGAKEQAEGKKS